MHLLHHTISWEKVDVIALKTLLEAEDIASKGIQEIVITGVNIGTFQDKAKVLVI